MMAALVTLAGGMLATLWLGLTLVARAIRDTRPPGPPPPVREWSPRRAFYGSTARLEALIADPWAPIEDVVAEVHALCESNLRTSGYYRTNAQRILYVGHPWWRFVQSGEAAWLGWDESDLHGTVPLWRPEVSRPAAIQTQRRRV